jgi:TPR repeat protein
MRLGWLALCGVFVASDLMAQDEATVPPESGVTSEVASETELSQDGDDAAFKVAVQAVRDKQFRNAVDLFLPLAENDEADAQFNLAYLLRLGLGRPQNYGEAYFWASLSALGGEERAVDLVEDLQALLPDKQREAVVKSLQDRLSKQIESGDDSAPEKLGRVYADFAVKPDMENAFVWFSICHALGKLTCEDGMARAIEDMPPEAIVKVQTKAAEVFANSAFAGP